MFWIQVGLYISSALAMNFDSLSQVRDAHELPAVTVGTWSNGELYQETAGVRKKGEEVPATDGDLWHLGSNGKAITATLGAVLIEQGMISWETPMSEVFTGVHADFNQITLRELFAHRAGVTKDIMKYQDGRFWRFFRRSQKSLREQRREFAEFVLSSPASHDVSQFVYSNSGYIVAAAVLAKVAGASWEDLVQKHIFSPLEMRCGFGPPGAEAEPGGPVIQPWPHSETVGAIDPTYSGADNPMAFGPAGAIHCSMKSWLKFAQVHLSGLRGHETSILSAEGFKNLHADYKGQGYTSGGLVYQEKDTGVVLGHNGSNTLNFAFLILDPAGNTAYVAATNIGGALGMKGAQAAMKYLGSPDVCLGEHCLLSNK